MDYTKQSINNSVIIEDKKKEVCVVSEQTFSSSSSLTTYKKVVDISNKNKIYGLSKNDYKEVQEKIKKQNCFLQYNYIYDKISGTQIPLKDLVISANHNPNDHLLLPGKQRSILPQPSSYWRFPVSA